MGYDYFIRVTLAEPEVLATWSDDKLADYSQRLRQTYVHLSSTRETFPEFGVKTRGYFSCSDVFYYRNEPDRAPVRLTDELRIFSEAVPDLKLDVLYLSFDLTDITVYELFQGTVTEVESMEMPSQKVGRVTLHLSYDTDTEDDDDIQLILNGDSTLADHVPRPPPPFLTNHYVGPIPMIPGMEMTPTVTPTVTAAPASTPPVNYYRIPRFLD